MDLLSILTDISMLPWWFWAMFIGLAVVVTGFMLTHWLLSVFGVAAMLIGFIGAIRSAN